ncbi:MAG: saccharopine dehydrogenase family protein [Bacteroidia bacterium]
MRKILLLGAGRSATALIKYLLDNSQTENWQLTVADLSEELARAKIKNNSNAKAISFDIKDENQRADEIKNSDIVISLLPTDLHFLVAVDCIRFKKNLITASYISDVIHKLNDQAVEDGVLLLNEMGLDPGIDHMSAMQIIDRLKSENAELLSFKSYTGGLIAPECNNNPWGYKFTWNPRNVILAGQGTAKYIENGMAHYIPYSRLFTQTEKLSVDGVGNFEGYANRDSPAYRHHYRIENIPTLLRGTLRTEGFCESWNVFVQLGLTDDSFTVESSAELSYAQLVEALLPKNIQGKDLKSKVAVLCGIDAESKTINKIEWTGIFSNEKIKIDRATPAQILQDLLLKRWALEENDKDMVVMQHQFEFEDSGKKTNSRRKLISSLVVKGDNAENTAMAKTVGLPMGIAAKLILNEKIKLTGVQIPVMEEIYKPVLKELEMHGIVFREKNLNA